MQFSFTLPGVVITAKVFEYTWPPDSFRSFVTDVYRSGCLPTGWRTKPRSSGGGGRGMRFPMYVVTPLWQARQCSVTEVTGWESEPENGSFALRATACMFCIGREGEYPWLPGTVL